MSDDEVTTEEILAEWQKLCAKEENLLVAVSMMLEMDLTKGKPSAKKIFENPLLKNLPWPPEHEKERKALLMEAAKKANNLLNQVAMTRKKRENVVTMRVTTKAGGGDQVRTTSSQSTNVFTYPHFWSSRYKRTRAYHSMK